MTYKNKYVKVILAALVALTSLAGRAEDGKVIRKTDGSITFVVDEGLTPIEESNRYFLDGEKMARTIVGKDRTIIKDAYNTGGALPKWLSRLSIGHLTIKGKMTRKEKRRLSRQLRSTASQITYRNAD